MHKLFKTILSMFVFGIETTCDETACAIVREGKEILSSVIYSQTDLHERYGGVFPELASRRHLEVLPAVMKEAFDRAGVSPHEIDLVAVAKGPGLIGALLIGMNAAKTLSLSWNKPWVGVNHVEAHLYAAMMDGLPPRFPVLGVVISGGHTFLVKILEFGVYEMIGKTVDDAIGEAFDKVAVMLGLPYPGGPAVEELAKQGDPSRFSFKAGRVKERPWDFSFSGLKTNILYTVRDLEKNLEEERAHIAASFQETALSNIVDKATQAALAFGCHAIYLGGGVSNNRRLRELFAKAPVPVHFPPPGLSLDNAAMIAGLGYHLYQREGKGDPLDLEPMTRIPL